MLQQGPVLVTGVGSGLTATGLKSVAAAASQTSPSRQTSVKYEPVRAACVLLLQQCEREVQVERLLTPDSSLNFEKKIEKNYCSESD